jgi:hypothetical protein
MEGVMEKVDQIYLWKRLYWRAVDNGLEPGKAQRFAYRAFSRCGVQFPAPKHHVRVCTSFPAVTV